MKLQQLGVVRRDPLIERLLLGVRRAVLTQIDRRLRHHAGIGLDVELAVDGRRGRERRENENGKDDSGLRIG